jgi:ABC-2 type transport system permease protein
MNGFLTLLYKELLRFWKVGFQTVFAPMLSTLLYLLIFSHMLEERVQAYPGVTYTVFLIPGLVIMAMLQNAFANSSSSLIQSIVSGNHIFMLLSPLSYQEIFTAYVLASVARGLW